MNKIARRISAAVLTVVFCLAPVSCASDPVISGRTSAESVPEDRTMTLSRAYEKFSGYYAEGHTDFINAVASETDRLREEISAADAEVKKLIGEYYGLHSKLGLSDSPEEFSEKFIAPYESYIEARLGAADLCGDAFQGVSSAVSAGGSSGGDAGLLMEYVHCANLLAELEDLIDLLS